MFTKSAFLALSSLLFLVSAEDNILEEGNNYIVQKATDVDFKQEKGVFYKWSEIIPTNQTVPEDLGGNYGDLGFHNYLDEELLARDTLLNERIYSEPVIITYRRNFEGYSTYGVFSLNFGRERGFTNYVAIGLESGHTEASVLVPPGKRVRVFLESYGYKKN